MHLKHGAALQGGKYRIEKILGQGGFGITYLAYQPGLERYVAIKEFFMKEHCNRDAGTFHVSVPSVGSRELVAQFKEKFIKEARMIAGYDHSHIVSIYDNFEENGTAYYVMKYYGGADGSTTCSLAGLPLPLSCEEAVGYVRQISSALSYLHARSVMHLDVKPSNVLIDGDGNAVLIDFGVSKRYDQAGNQTSSTPVGVSKGYAPIEQYSQSTLEFNPATDIYSLGATLYKLLTGDTPPEASLLVSNPKHLSFPSSVSDQMAALIRRCLSPSLAARPQSITGFLGLLDDALAAASVNDDTVVATDEGEDTVIVGNDNAPAKKKSRRWLWWLLAAVMLAVAGVFAVMSSKSGGDAAEHSGREHVLEQAKLEAKNSKVEQERKQYEADLKDYNGKMDDADKKAGQQKYDDAMKLYQQAASLENKYKGSKEYSSSFARKASSKVTEMQKKTETSYSNGVLRVKGVEYPMVWVSGGDFQMGSSSGESDEKPVHTVSLDGYSIGKYEVIQELWEAVMGSNPSGFNGRRRPVKNVSWYDCDEFIRKLNSMTGQQFRLPTEAEWEYAARGGRNQNSYTYSGSNTVGRVAWYDDNSGSQTHEVGGKSPNSLGIHDMSGNVWEWCYDAYSSDYYSKSPTNNPKNEGSAGSFRVLRGGSWYVIANYCRVSNRNVNAPGYRSSDYGFRLCL